MVSTLYIYTLVQMHYTHIVDRTHVNGVYLKEVYLNIVKLR